MHEMSLAVEVLHIVEDMARREGAQRVTLIRLEIGTLAAVMPEALCFCFDAVARGTLADGAQLQLSERPALGRCGGCGQTMPLQTLYDACADCGATAMQLMQGNEMRVVSMQIE
jgi:hydrogenase nickel incorporation protein HypA/HybF